MEINSGEVFYAKNSYITPKPDGSTEKYHLCIDPNMYFFINTKGSDADYKISKEDCSILKHESYINCSCPLMEPIANFKCIKKEELSQAALKGLIEKVKVSIVLSPMWQDRIIKGLQKALK